MTIGQLLALGLPEETELVVEQAHPDGFSGICFPVRRVDAVPMARVVGSSEYVRDPGAPIVLVVR